MKSLISQYRSLVERGLWDFEPGQESVVYELERLNQDLNSYMKSKQGLWGKITRHNQKPPFGLYIYGGVGRGKSVLMDLFFSSTCIEHRRRVHFHAFMLETHARINSQRQASTSGDPIKYVARNIASKTELLCFDEFQVSDPADAMILQRLFKKMFERNLIVVATSNRPTKDLYKDGLNRDLFLPFIELLEDRCNVIEMDVSRDYRLEKLTSMPAYFTPVNSENLMALEQAFLRIAGTENTEPTVLTVQGRELSIKRTANGVGMTDFDELCRKPLGTADYLAIAEVFNTLFVTGIPCMEPEHRNEAKRFINLVDVLYEHNVNLICSADTEPEQLYRKGNGSFEFARAVSRLFEMQTTAYLSRPHQTTSQ